MKICYRCMSQIDNDKEKTCPNCGDSLDDLEGSAEYLKPGTVLQNRFIVGKPLGAGGFGKTYIGWDQRLTCKVAIKEYYPEHLSVRKEDGVTVTVNESSQIQRYHTGMQQFLEEARNVANLRNVKGVVSIYSFFEENGTAYFVMEYLEGMTVKEILKKADNKVDYEWCRKVVLTVLYTLKEIHKNGVLHRDIAPDNIFVTDEGVIKLIDFGAAKHSSALVNEDSEIILKVGYAPIEQYSRKTQQGPYTDIYAVAALFYRLVVGRKPIPANERVVEDTLPAPSGLGVQLPEQAEMAIMVSLNVQPPYRLQSAEEFIEALDGQNFVPMEEPLLIAEEPKKSWVEVIRKLPTWEKVLVPCVVLVLVAGIAASAVILNSRETVESVADMSVTVTMPQCKDKSEEEAIDELKKQGFSTVKTIYLYGENDTLGNVQGQDPAAGDKVESSAEVTLEVSGGTLKVTVPDFVNASIAEAEQFWSTKNINYQMEEDYSDDVPKDSCKKQFPEANAVYEIDSGDSVVLTKSLGPRKDYERKMPDLSGMSAEEAKKECKKLLPDATITVKDEEDYGSTEKGKISSQRPKPGDIVNIRDDNNAEKKIELYRSRGPKPTATPKPTAAPTPKPTKRPSTPKPTAKPTKRPSTPKRTSKPKATKKPSSGKSESWTSGGGKSSSENWSSRDDEENW